jgi:hypothetical protein
MPSRRLRRHRRPRPARTASNAIGMGSDVPSTGTPGRRWPTTRPRQDGEGYRRNRVMPKTAPRMTTGQPADGQPHPAHGTMAANGLQRIVRTRGIVATASARAKQPDLQGRQDPAIPMQQDDQEGAHVRSGCRLRGRRRRRGVVTPNRIQPGRRDVIPPEAGFLQASTQVTRHGLQPTRGEGGPSHEHQHHRLRQVTLLEPERLPDHPARPTADNRPTDLPTGHDAQAGSVSRPAAAASS